MKNWIKQNLYKWIINGIKIILVSSLSYFFLEKLTDFDFIKKLWESNERYYLGGYVTIQAAVAFILFEGFGKLFELRIFTWIKKNEDEIQIQLDKSDHKEIERSIFGIVKFLVRYDLVDVKDLDELGTVSFDKKEFKQKWSSIIRIIKDLTGVFILALTNLLVFYGASMLFIWLTLVFISLAVISFVGLIIYYVLIENLHIVNICVNRVASSGRLIRQKDNPSLLD